MNTVPTKHRNFLALLLTLVIAVALTVRIWHDHRTSRIATISDLEQQARANPDDIQVQLAWGTALQSQHRPDEAEAVFKASARLVPNDVRPLDALARLAMERYQAHDAIEYTGASLRLDPKNAANWSCLGTLLLKKDPPAAIQAFRHATSLDPKDAFSWLKLGTLEMDQQQFDRGLHDLQQAASLNPNDLETEIAIGNSARFNNRPTLAKTAFEQALLLQADDPRALLGSAYTTLELDPSPDGLKRVDQQMVKLMAEKPSGGAYLVRGHWDMLMRQYNSAVSDLKTALAMDPKLNDGHSLLSQAYAALGKSQLAQQESKTFLTNSKASSIKPTSNVVGSPGPK